MSGKHIFFYHSDCGNCQRLLNKIQGTQLQASFIYINIEQAQRLPPNIQGVPAILPAFQPETSLLQGSHAFRWIESALSKMGGTITVKSHPDPHGPVNPRDTIDELDGMSAKAIHRPVVVDSSGPKGEVTGVDILGNSPYEMGGIGYSDKYSFIDNTSAMSHRYSYVNGHSGPGVIGERVTREPGDAVQNVKGMTMKARQMESDLKRLQAERDQIPNGIRRVG